MKAAATTPSQVAVRLFDDWSSRHRAAGIPWAKAQRWWNDVILERYGERHRAYHTLTHIGDLYEQFLKQQQRLTEPDAVYYAIIFHDIIYDAHSKDSEDQSAKLFGDYWNDTRGSSPNLPPDPMNVRVQRLILATKSHMKVDCGTDTDMAFFLDMDLSILGAPPAQYDQYSANIRFEYQHIPLEMYRQGRTAVLQGFLGAPRLFRTAVYHDLLDAAARANLQKEIKQLQGPYRLVEPLLFVDAPSVAHAELDRSVRTDAYRMSLPEVQHVLAMSSGLCYALRQPATKELLGYIVASGYSPPSRSMSPWQQEKALLEAHQHGTQSASAADALQLSHSRRSPVVHALPDLFAREHRLEHDPEATSVVVHSLVILPAFRRQGLAWEMMQSFLEQLSTTAPHVQQVFIAAPSTFAAALCRRFGFCPMIVRSDTPTAAGSSIAASQEEDAANAKCPPDTAGANVDLLAASASLSASVRGADLRWVPLVLTLSRST